MTAEKCWKKREPFFEPVGGIFLKEDSNWTWLLTSRSSKRWEDTTSKAIIENYFFKIQRVLNSKAHPQSAAALNKTRSANVKKYWPPFYRVCLIWAPVFLFRHSCYKSVQLHIWNTSVLSIGILSMSKSMPRGRDNHARHPKQQCLFFTWVRQCLMIGDAIKKQRDLMGILPTFVFR